MKKFKQDKGQQEMLQKFFDKRKLWNQEIPITNFITYLMMGISVMFIFVPYQVWGVEDQKIFMYIYMIYILAVSVYIQQFSLYKDMDKNKKITDILSVLPVSSVQIMFYKMKMVIKLCRIVTAAAAVSQCFFAITVMHTFSVFNILLPVAVLMVIPLLFAVVIN